MKTLCILGGSREATPVIKKARELFYQTIVVSLCEPEECDDWIRADVYDPEAVVKALEGWHLEGVIAAACDAGLTVATVAEKWGLESPGIGNHELVNERVELAHQLSSKNWQYRLLEDRGLPVIPWKTMTVEDIATLYKVVGWDDYYIVKPAVGRGAQKVLRVHIDDWDDKSGFLREHGYQPDELIVVQPFVEGLQVSGEAIVTQSGKGTLACQVFWADRNYSRLDETAPYVIEDGGNCPSRMTTRQFEKVYNLAYDTIERLGVKNTTVKFDLVWAEEEDKPYIVEIAVARLSGGRFCTHSIPLAYGYDFVANAIQVACGDLPRRFVLQRYYFPAPGQIEHMPADAGDLETLGWEFFADKKEGEVIEGYRSHGDRPACLMVAGKSWEDAVDMLASLEKAIKVKTLRASDVLMRLPTRNGG